MVLFCFSSGRLLVKSYDFLSVSPGPLEIDFKIKIIQLYWVILLPFVINNFIRESFSPVLFSRAASVSWEQSRNIYKYLQYVNTLHIKPTVVEWTVEQTFSCKLARELSKSAYLYVLPPKTPDLTNSASLRSFMEI